MRHDRLSVRILCSHCLAYPPNRFLDFLLRSLGRFPDFSARRTSCDCDTVDSRACNFARLDRPVSRNRCCGSSRDWIMGLRGCCIPWLPACLAGWPSEARLQGSPDELATGARDESSDYGRSAKVSPLQSIRNREGRPSRLRRHGILVAFSGVDGSGKSTQVGLLEKSFEKINMPVLRIRSRWRPVLSLPLLVIMRRLGYARVH